MRLLLANPNTDARVTAEMLEIARAVAPAGFVLEGLTAPFGARLITDAAALAVAARAIVTMAETVTGPAEGLIVSAFGDPGLHEARAVSRWPVTGIAEAAMAEAAAGGRRFAVVTTTPALGGAIRMAAERYGHGAVFAGLYLTPGDPVALTATPGELLSALEVACREAVRGGVEAVVIGGGPLARAARALAGRLPIPVIEPVPAAVRLAVRRAPARDRASVAE